MDGSAPDKAPAALLLIDVINDLDFEGAEHLLEHALPMARRLADLKRRAKEAGLPAIYVNDNFGRWRSDFQSLVDRCLDQECIGRPIVERLQPEENDYFVLKPKHSGFHSTALDILLLHFGASRLILTGIAANICVLFTANDAYMRDYRLYVPEDCVASNSATEARHALDQMHNILRADIRPSTEIELQLLMRESDASGG